MARKSKGLKEKRRKRVTVRLVAEKHGGQQTEPYRILADLRAKEHNHLVEARIGLAWRIGWKADTDKHLQLGQVRKRGDLDRELDNFDFIIMLNEEAWPTLNETQKRALLDHQLCHCALSLDADGTPKYNDRDRLVCRIKKHDVEEFRAIVERNGLWTQDLEEIAKAAINDAKRPLLDESKESEKADSKSAASNPDAWKRKNISALKEFLSEKAFDALDGSSVSTLGDLSERMTRDSNSWHKNIGVHGRFKEVIEEAFRQFHTKAA